MRILFATCSPAGYMAPPRLSGEQVNCGPDWVDREIDGLTVSLNTPVGSYDLAAIAQRLPAEQQPDAVVCLVDASWRSIPRNLKAFSCPKILLVADTHHLDKPITGMVRYAQSEPFDRVVLLYDRHHWQFFHAAGVRNLHWLPGLTFPHRDDVVKEARSSETPANQVMFVGQTGICHPRRLQLLMQLEAQRLPLSIRAVSQREALSCYGSSSVGFNASLNGDLNLRVFEIAASGALLLTDALAPESGLAGLFPSGEMCLTYATCEELVERARWAVENPAEARRIGMAAAHRFDELFSDTARLTSFQRLVADGFSRPEFELRSERTSVFLGDLGERLPHFIKAYEVVQELHRNLDRVAINLDESVPAGFAAMCETLPRIEVRQGALVGGQRSDFLGIGRASFESLALLGATKVWSWEDPGELKTALARRCSSMGLAMVEGDLALFSRQKINSHNNDGAVALVRLQQGGYEDALFLAKRELERNAKSSDALLVMLELAQEKGNLQVAQSVLTRLRAVVPHHPRLKELAQSSPTEIRGRRAKRLARVAQANLDRQQEVEAGKIAREAIAVDPQSAVAHFVLGVLAARSGDIAKAAPLLGRATQLAPERTDFWYEQGFWLHKLGRSLDAMGALLHVVEREPVDFIHQFTLGSVALAVGHGRIAVEAFEAALRIEPDHRRARLSLERAIQLSASTDYSTPRNLLFSHVEVTRLQGTGVLIERFFPRADDFVTVRSRTLYQGKVNFGGLHFSMDLPGLGEAERKAVLRRILAPFSIQRILCVPFFATDFMHAIAAREFTGAPLATYVMDDQVLHAREVSHELAGRLFAVSDLRLAISPEMIQEYTAWFRCAFELLPPIIVNRADENPNSWSETDGAVNHCAMVGNVWSAKQFEQLRAFTRAAGLKVDWFGNSKVAWLPQDQKVLEADGIYCHGFVPEPELARRLSRYPFALLPSGMLDGTEDNEWLTRLSLPSRMVFIVTKTQTPMLVLGSGKTAAARFVHQFGLGTSSNYDAAEAPARIREITDASRRPGLLENARRAGAAFLVPDCGEWIWQSLAAKSALPTPFDSIYNLRRDEVSSVSRPGDGPTADEQVASILKKLADTALHASYLPANEPRQRMDVRGAVLFLHDSLRAFGDLKTRLLVIERLSKSVKNHRGILVTWAELLEQAGDKAEAAAKARQALSIYYDDVYTQTLFVRCVGDVNHHVNAQDRFCPRPFENFEIYKDGSVFPCNCTQVPFPIGNAHTQTKEEIWQSPVAQAIRQSILDGSFRFCSPMTCWRRFDLPKKSEQPEKWAELQRIGVSGDQPPKHFNLSYDLSCNLSCPSCRNAQIMATGPERAKLEHVRDQIVLPLLQNKIAETVYITGSGDAFGSPHFRGILKEICDPKYDHVQITLGTNGQLITERLWEEFKPLHPRFNDITISIDGATPETFERIRRGSTWEKLQRTMGILAAARRARVIRRVMVNMVVQTQNFLEMRPLLALCKGWAVDGIRFYRIRQWGNVVPGAFMDSDVANPLHPRHGELMAELAHPDFADRIVDRYDMFELIERAQAAAKAGPVETQLIELKALPAQAQRPAGASTTLVSEDDDSAPRLVEIKQHLDTQLATAALPRTLNLQPIDVCNSRCIMCNIWKEGQPAKLSLEELRVFLSHPFFAEVQHVGITGGEPTLRKDLLEIYQMLPVCLPRLKGASFITHGMQTERAVDVYSRVHAAYVRRGLTFEGMVSLDGVGEVHDRIRGRKNAFDGASRTLLQLKARGVSVMAACTIVRSNVYELHDLLAWGKDNGVYVRFRIAEFIRRLYNENCDEQIRAFTPREIRHLVSFLYLLIKEYEPNEVIRKTYESDLSVLTGGSRLIGCPYQSGAALNVGSMGSVASCAPKGEAFTLPGSVPEAHAALAPRRAEVAAKHCASCIHDYHDDWNAATRSEQRAAEQCNRDLYGYSEEQLTEVESPAVAFDLRGMKQILLAGWYGTETAGDIAILQGIVSGYLRENPALRFQLLSWYPYYTRTTLAEWPANLRDRITVVADPSGAAWQATKECDAVVMAGGPLMDLAETRKILCLFKCFADQRKPRVIEGCGIGPLHNLDYRWHVCRIARLATRISVRDQASRDYLRLLAIRKDIAVRPDPAVDYLRSLAIRHHGGDGKVIRCFLRELTSEYPQDLNPAQATGQLVVFLRKLLAWYPEHRVELWAMHHFPVGNDDRLFARMLVREVGDPRLSCDWLPRTPAEIFAAMAAAELCICMRFHSCVFAAEAGVPFLAIDYTAGGKIRAFLEDEGQAHRRSTLAELSTLDHADFKTRICPTSVAPTSAVAAEPGVLHVLQRLTGGGGARAAVWLARYSREQGGPTHRIVSLAPADEAGLAVALQHGVEVMDAPEWMRLHAALASADIVLVHWWNHPDLSRLFRRQLPPMRLALWLHVGGYHAPQVLTSNLIQFADLSVACSPHTYAHPVFEGLSAIDRHERTAMVLAGADFSRIEGVVPRPHDGFRVGYIGTLDPVKMHAGFVAMSSAVSVPDVRFVLCGSGDTGWLAKQAAELGTAERFEWVGQVEDIRSVIETLDVYGYPLCPETYAAAELNLQEVMYAGVPVVAFPHGGIARLIVHGETGLLVNSPEEYTAAIERLHRDPIERARLGSNAAAYARQHWGARNAAREFNQQFSRLLVQPKRDRRWGVTNVSPVESDPAREFALYPGTRMFIQSLGSSAAPFLASLSAPVGEDRIKADNAIAQMSHLMRYNGVQTAREAWPKEPAFHLWAGVGAVREGNHAVAIDAFLQARQHGCSDWRLAWYLAQEWLVEGRLDDAAIELNQVLRMARTFAPAQEMLRKLAGSTPAAKNHSAATPAAGVRDRINQALQLLKQGQPVRAREQLQLALNAQPGQLELMELVAELDCRLGNIESARRLHAAILAQAPTRATPRLRAIQSVIRRETTNPSSVAKREPVVLT